MCDIIRVDSVVEAVSHVVLALIAVLVLSLQSALNNVMHHVITLPFQIVSGRSTLTQVLYLSTHFRYLYLT